ncbi:ATP-binding cassette domain-containing protein [Nonomuraea sp. NPDC050643]|uniref:ATP-binding cassette domain-containing protein n=1 Tax=Nonomuraea sp. NPDC050643 TaxID=3155660 RepID=UPI0033F794C5
MIQVRGLTKRYGGVTAVHDLSFTVRPGQVTGFLGPNGSGKSTTMRVILGLDRPGAGSATVNGRPYAAHPDPLRQAGSLLEVTPAHGGRTAYHHLLGLARTHAIPAARVTEVLALVGLAEAAGRRVGGFSLGMRQRLGIAAALLGDPSAIILDEPVNGLDPDGVLWLRTLLKSLAAEGRTVLVSSHLMSEMALTARHLAIIGRGRLLADISVADLVARVGADAVLVRGPRPTDLRDLLVRHQATVTATGPGALEVAGLSAETISALAFRAGLEVHELTPRRASLEQAYMELTRGEKEIR